MAFVCLSKTFPYTPHVAGFDQRFRRYEVERVLILADFRRRITFDRKVIGQWKLMRWIQREILLFIHVSKFTKCGMPKSFGETLSIPPFSPPP